METNRWSRLGALYAVTVFVSAFLLFQIQPLISRYILPWFGGTPAVWTTCLVFFQTVLFGGYAYAHVSEHYLRPRARTIVHLALIVLALFTLPIAPSDWWKPADSDYPAGRILALLAVCVGLPYFVLSSTGPLVQAWFSQTLPGKSPYRLYSLSNLGSLLALLSYPFMVEPLLDGHEQSWWWTAGFVLFCILSGTACWQTAKLRRDLAAAADSPGLAASSQDEAPPFWTGRFLWLALPALASALLLATTNHICLDVPSVPFLWVAPLSLYLLSFIIAFDHERWYRRLPYALAALLTVYLTAAINNPAVWSLGWLGQSYDRLSGAAADGSQPKFNYAFELFCQLAGLLVLCMLCHGELIRLRPKSSRYLTSFYLMIAAGGALGGLAVSLVAPLVFKTYAEWKIGLVLGCVLALGVLILRDAKSWRQGTWGWSSALGAGGAVLGLAAFVGIAPLLWSDEISRFTVLEQVRNFYGVLSVVNERTNILGGDVNTPYDFNVLYNGSTRHGTQFTAPGMRRLATTYYSEGSGLGRTLVHYLKESERSGDPMRVGAVGLGVGTLATYIRTRQTIRFYEINPDVCRLADEHFTYLSSARTRGAKVEIVVGDARLSLERELAQPGRFDLLVLDAFSSDSIPMHLLTKEAFEVYLPHLAPLGAIAIHVTNRNINLSPVVYGLAEAIEFQPVALFTADFSYGSCPAQWIVLSRNQELLEKLRAIQGNYAPAPPPAPLPLWTDRRHNLLEIVWWRAPPPLEPPDSSSVPTEDSGASPR